MLHPIIFSKCRVRVVILLCKVLVLIIHHIVQARWDDGVAFEINHHHTIGNNDVLGGVDGPEERIELCAF